MSSPYNMIKQEAALPDEKLNPIALSQKVADKEGGSH
jgi:hypothetical protein